MEKLVARQAEETELAKFLHARVVGQNQVIASLVRAHNKMVAGISDPTRPISTLLFMGPTGVGKTKLVEAYCEYLFGEDQKPMVLNCSEFQNEMCVSALIGSSFGYIGSDKKPRFAKENIEGRRSKDGKQLQVLLLDEIEKSVPAVYNSPGAKANGMSSPFFQLMLPVFDRGRITLAQGEQVDFTKTIIFMTSNLGARELVANETDASRQAEVAKIAAQEFFSPEQFNRIDQVCVFNQLKQEQITLITDLEIVAVSERAGIEIEYEDAVRDAIAKDGYDVRYGARELKRAVDIHITGPLAQFVAERNLRKGDRMHVKFAEGGEGLEFFKMEGKTSVEEKPTFASKPVVAPEQQVYRSKGYVRTMLDRKFRYGDSTGAHVYQYVKSTGYNPVDPDAVLAAISKPAEPGKPWTGWNTESKDPRAMVAFVLNDWVKKNWAVKIGYSYQVKE